MSQPVLYLVIVVPANAASGLDVLQDDGHPKTAVVEAGTSHPHVGFERQDFPWFHKSPGLTSGLPVQL